VRKKVGRVCSRAGCTTSAVQTLTYIYADSTAVLGPLATFAEPHSYDLCAHHAKRLTVPNGWQVIKPEADADVAGPSEDDLMAIADAVREVANESKSQPQSTTAELGRRGHLRVLPSN